MKNGKCPIQQGVEVRLSGVVCVPHTPHLNSDALEKWIISSFREARFQNVLKRAKVLPQTSWFWHHLNHTQLSEAAIAIVACNTNDYKQILIKQNELAQAVQELAPQSELLLLISSDQNFVFGTVLETLESFSTHILLREQKQQDSNGTKFSYLLRQAGEAGGAEGAGGDKKISALTEVAVTKVTNNHSLLPQPPQLPQLPQPSFSVIATFEKFAMTNFQERSLTGGGKS